MTGTEIYLSFIFIGRYSDTYPAEGLLGTGVISSAMT